MEINVNNPRSTNHVKKTLGVIVILVSFITAFLAIMGFLYNIILLNKEGITDTAYNIGYWIATIIVPIGLLSLALFLYRKGRRLYKESSN